MKAYTKAEDTAGLREALEDSTELLRGVRDENDEGAIAAQIVVNVAALGKGKGGAL